MAMLNQTSDNSARSDRRRRALIAYLTAVGETDISKLDYKHPILKNCTIEELYDGIELIKQRGHDALSRSISRMMGEQSDFAIGCVVTKWMPLNQLRYINLKSRIVSRDRCRVYYNDVDAFQACYRVQTPSRARLIAYHIQSYVASGDSGYYKAEVSSGDRVAIHKVSGLNRSDFPPTRSLTSVLSTTRANTILRAPDCELITPDDPAYPLHIKCARL